jgi:hypothetical protein
MTKLGCRKGALAWTSEAVAQAAPFLLKGGQVVVIPS